MNPRAWFVTGTDTDVGKTVVTAALTVLLAERSPYVVKPAQTGVDESDPGDLDEVRRLAGDVPGEEGIRLKAALAPTAAARVAGVDLPGIAAHATTICEHAQRHDVIVEGAGGVLVDLAFDGNLLDLAQQVTGQGVTVHFVVVARSGLGTLNHTALTVKAIRAANQHVAGVVIGSWPTDPGLAENQNLIDLPLIAGVPLLGRVPAGAGTLNPDEFQGHANAWLRLPG